MSKFSARIAPYVLIEFQLSQAAARAGDYRLQFTHLERAHVLGQTSTYHHVKVHLYMMLWGINQLSFTETAGQLTRILGAATKTVFGLVPMGNTGGSDVSPFKPMPIPDDLRAILDTVKK